MEPRSLNYRPDIDGLRAVAVLSVVFFHFNRNWLPGGFIGVDIFFVISGYLITGIVAKQVDSGSFSFADFYLRRVRRILPAAFIVTIVTVALGSVLMLPEDAVLLAKSGFASSLSAANIYFWAFLDTGYFAASSDLQPLLHMWSLGVEEQFYLVWPALLYLSYRYGGQHLQLVIAAIIAVVSFWIAEHYLGKDQKFAYYMLPARAGELLIGAMLSMLTRSTSRNWPRWSIELISSVGLALLAWSLVSISENSDFPGIISAVPALGTALIILAGCYGAPLLTRALSVRPLVSIGLVSFSLYLWHWPVLALYRYAYGDLDISSSFLCLMLIMALTYASYFFVERPFRPSGSKVKLIAIPALGIATLALSMILVQAGGVLDPLSPKAYQDKLASLRSGARPAAEASYVCQGAFDASLFESEKCVAGNTSKEPKTLLIGDSNAAHFAGYLSVIAEEQNISIRNVEHHACPPFPDGRSEKYVRDGYKVSCPSYYEKARAEFHKYDTIIVAASWLAYQMQHKDAFDEDIEALLDDLDKSGKNIVIGLKAPTFNAMDRQCAEKALKVPFLDCQSKTILKDSGEMAVNRQIIDLSARKRNISTFSVRNLICNGDICNAFSNGTPLYYDGGHLSLAGSEKLGQIAVAGGLIPESLKVMAGN